MYLWLRLNDSKSFLENTTLTYGNNANDQNMHIQQVTIRKD